MWPVFFSNPATISLNAKFRSDAAAIEGGGGFLQPGGLAFGAAGQVVGPDADLAGPRGNRAGSPEPSCQCNPDYATSNPPVNAILST